MKKTMMLVLCVLALASIAFAQSQRHALVPFAQPALSAQAAWENSHRGQVVDHRAHAMLATDGTAAPLSLPSGVLHDTSRSGFVSPGDTEMVHYIVDRAANPGRDVQLVAHATGPQGPPVYFYPETGMFGVVFGGLRSGQAFPIYQKFVSPDTVEGEYTLDLAILDAQTYLPVQEDVFIRFWVSKTGTQGKGTYFLDRSIGVQVGNNGYPTVVLSGNLPANADLLVFFGVPGKPGSAIGGATTSTDGTLLPVNVPFRLAAAGTATTYADITVCLPGGECITLQRAIGNLAAQ